MEHDAFFTDSVRQKYTQPYHDDPEAWIALRKCLQETKVEAVWEKHIQPGLTALQLPILLVWGSNDEYEPVAMEVSRHPSHATIPVTSAMLTHMHERLPESPRYDGQKRESG